MLKESIRKILPEQFIFQCSLAKKRFLYSQLLKKTASHYKIVEKELSSSKKIRFAAYVVFDSCFGASGLLQLMLKNPSKYEVKIVIIPDISRGEEHLLQQYNDTKSFFVNKYGSDIVLDGYNSETKIFLDYSSQFDVVYLSNPYDTMVNEVHGVNYLSKQKVLPIYISYGCMPDNYGCKVIMPNLEMSLFWKVFADNYCSYQDYRKYEISKGKNVILSGYSKMDDLAKCSVEQHDKKRIIVAPHHTVNNVTFPLSNFLQYSDFLLKLPEKYPQIDFVFRPHPLLFTNLINNGIWSKEKVDDYLKQLKDLGVVYSYGGDYLQLFADSDGIIHDCSSFVVEYLYTEKPCCYAAKPNYKKIFSTLGKSCLKNYYMAFNTKQIEAFIEDVIINEKDTLKEQRIKFTKEHLALNYPNVSEKIIDEISNNL